MTSLGVSALMGHAHYYTPAKHQRDLRYDKQDTDAIRKNPVLPSAKPMGYDKQRIPDQDINEELICAICKCVMKDPLQIRECEHIFCSECIKSRIKEDGKCPTDQNEAKLGMLGPPPKVIIRLLSQLQIKCQYEQYDCKKLLPLTSIEEHELLCKYHPAREVKCEGICGLRLIRKIFKDHDCVTQLKAEIAFKREQLEQKDKIIRQLHREAKERRDLLEEIFNSELYTATTKLGEAIRGHLDDTPVKAPID